MMQSSLPYIYIVLFIIFNAVAWKYVRYCRRFEQAYVVHTWHLFIEWRFVVTVILRFVVRSKLIGFERWHERWVHAHLISLVRKIRRSALRTYRKRKENNNSVIFVNRSIINARVSWRMKRFRHTHEMIANNAKYMAVIGLAVLMVSGKFRVLLQAFDK